VETEGKPFWFRCYPLLCLQTIHSSVAAAWAPSSSVPSAVVLSTPDSSRNLRKRRFHLGLPSRTRTPLGLLPSHASALVALSRSFEQWSRVWDLDIRTLSRQNQHLSSCLLQIRLGCSADLQWPVHSLPSPGMISWAGMGGFPGSRGVWSPGGTEAWHQQLKPGGMSKGDAERHGIYGMILSIIEHAQRHYNRAKFAAADFRTKKSFLHQRESTDRTAPGAHRSRS